MPLLPNTRNNRIFLRFALCLMAAAVVSGIFGTVIPHFYGWIGVGPVTLMVLISIFVIPYSMRR